MVRWLPLPPRRALALATAAAPPLRGLVNEASLTVETATSLPPPGVREDRKDLVLLDGTFQTVPSALSALSVLNAFLLLPTRI